MKLLVLAGGFGTRLKSVVTDVPKALAPIGDVSFLHLQLAQWRHQGLQDFVFLLHHQANLIIDFINCEKYGVLKNCKVQWIIEPIPMGTGGALAHAINQLDITGDFLTTNADTWLGSGIQEVWLKAAPAMAVVKVADASRYGRVEFDNNNTVTAFHEKSSIGGNGWINAGLGHFHSDLFSDWNHQPFSLEKNKISQWTNAGILKAVKLESEFIDIGIPEDYYRLCSWINSEKVGIL